VALSESFLLRLNPAMRRTMRRTARQLRRSENQTGGVALAWLAVCLHPECPWREHLERFLAEIAFQETQAKQKGGPA
jgi:hypothetical protein